MGKTTGFLEYPRQEGPVVPPLERLGNFREFHHPLSPAAPGTAGGPLHGLRACPSARRA